MINKASKVIYSEYEAARELGISVEQLRMLVKDYLAAGEDVPVESFKRADLVLLRVLASRSSVTVP